LKLEEQIGADGLMYWLHWHRDATLFVLKEGRTEEFTFRRSSMDVRWW